ncbi:hypothetical protein ZTR_02832 [Talaromyces verruculosus]|nr:hypothetical protein ZTR_02832 [Talaromyces verruculosus]
MSGAESLAIFGIACNVMQVIGCAQDAVHMIKAIYQSGSMDPDLAQTTDYMKGGLERLKNSLEKPLNQDEEELFDIANCSLETVRELKAELDKIAGTSAKGKRYHSVRGWFRAAVGGKKRIERLEKAMNNRQQILENRLTVRIWQRPYWINGKAGSGKSVLMKLLVDDPRTQSILNDANGTTIILSHFLWAAGQSLERNMQGLLYSLIHQLLATKPDLCRVILKKVPASRQKKFPSDWSTKELRALFLDVVPACEQHVCIFLDGLDEMGDYMALVDRLDHHNNRLAAADYITLTGVRN